MRASIKLIMGSIEELTNKIKEWEAGFEEVELFSDYEYLQSSIQNATMEIETLQEDLVLLSRANKLIQL